MGVPKIHKSDGGLNKTSTLGSIRYVYFWTPTPLGTSICDKTIKYVMLFDEGN